MSKTELNSTLSDYVKASASYPRCLPGLPGPNSEVALLRIFSAEQLSLAVATPDPLAALQDTECTRQQNQLIATLRQRCSVERGLMLCNLALLEKHAATMPSAFFNYCDSLRLSFAAFPSQMVKDLVTFRNKALDVFGELGSRTLDLILAPTTHVGTIVYFLKCAKEFGFRIAEPPEELLDQLQEKAGLRKEFFPRTVGSASSGTEINPTIRDFVTQELKLKDPPEPIELYSILDFLFMEKFEDVEAFKSGLYNYLTASSARFSSAPLPQFLLNTLVQNMILSLGNLLLIFTVSYSFMAEFTTSRGPQQLLEYLESLADSLGYLAEFLAIPHQLVFNRLLELRIRPDRWGYKIPNRPWHGDCSFLSKMVGPFGIVRTPDLVGKLSDSDYHLCFKWAGLTPEPSLSLDAAKATNPIFSRMVDNLVVQEHNPLLEKLLYSTKTLLAPPPLDPSEMPDITELDFEFSMEFADLVATTTTTQDNEATNPTPRVPDSCVV